MKNKLFFVWWLAIAALAMPAVLTGCFGIHGGDGPAFVDVKPGHDPIVVYSEWLAENGANMLDEFLEWERANEASLLTSTPAIHAAADAVRDSAPNQLRELRRITKQYKKAKSDVNRGQLQAAVDALVAIVNSVRAHMGKPPIPSTHPPILTFRETTP